MKTIVVGIGNLILGDDGIGIHIVRRIQEQNQIKGDVTFKEIQTGGMNLLDVIRGYDKAILIDAVSIPKVENGTVKQFRLDDLPSIHSYNPHDVTFPEALLLSKKIGESNIPKDIVIFGINLEKIPTIFSEELSPQIQQCIPLAVSMVLNELQKSLEMSTKRREAS